MYYKLIPSSIFLLIWAFATAQPNNALFLIEHHNLLGYINSNGEVVIEPQFFNAGDFSDGLAPVRGNGNWGYINAQGQYVIQPQYDYATPFENGLALVVRDSQVFRIDTKGNVPKGLSFHQVKGQNLRQISTDPNFFPVLSQCKVPQEGYEFMYPENFGDDVAVIGRFLNKSWLYDCTVIDTSGEFIVPPGKYAKIYPFKDGIAKVDINSPRSNEMQRTGFINKKGELIFEYKISEKYGQLLSGFSNQIAIVNLCKYWRKEPGFSTSSYYNYPGYMHQNGTILLSDTLVSELTPFSECRAFVRHMFTWQYQLIDTSMQVINQETFGKILFNGQFKNGLAFASGNSGLFGLINRSGEFVVKERFRNIHNVGIIDDYFFFEESMLDSRGGSISRFGVCDTSGNILIKPCFDQFDKRGFRNGLLRVWIDRSMAYINRNGQIVWKQNLGQVVGKANIDYVMESSFYPSKDFDAAQPGASQKEINFLHNMGCSEDTVSLRVDTTQWDTIRGSWLGYKVYLANLTTRNFDFRTEDGRLYFEVEALDSAGQWRGINNFSHSWCGNSYYNARLGANDFWVMHTPVFDGAFKTRFRVVAGYPNPHFNPYNDDDNPVITIYSNEFEGGLNPGQFWRKVPFMNSYQVMGIPVGW